MSCARLVVWVPLSTVTDTSAGFTGRLRGRAAGASGGPPSSRRSSWSSNWKPPEVACRSTTTMIASTATPAAIIRPARSREEPALAGARGAAAAGRAPAGRGCDAGPGSRASSPAAVAPGPGSEPVAGPWIRWRRRPRSRAGVRGGGHRRAPRHGLPKRCRHRRQPWPPRSRLRRRPAAAARQLSV